MGQNRKIRKSRHSVTRKSAPQPTAARRPGPSAAKREAAAALAVEEKQAAARQFFQQEVAADMKIEKSLLYKEILILVGLLCFALTR